MELPSLSNILKQLIRSERFVTTLTDSWFRVEIKERKFSSLTHPESRNQNGPDATGWV